MKYLHESAVIETDRPPSGALPLPPEVQSRADIADFCDVTAEAVTVDPVRHAATLASRQAAAEAKAAAEAGYAYARARRLAYVTAFSKAPAPEPIDAIGHVLDAIIDHIEGDPTALDAIRAQRTQIKQEHPKP